MHRPGLAIILEEGYLQRGLMKENEINFCPRTGKPENLHLTHQSVLILNPRTSALAIWIDTVYILQFVSSMLKTRLYR